MVEGVPRNGGGEKMRENRWQAPPPSGHHAPPNFERPPPRFERPPPHFQHAPPQFQRPPAQYGRHAPAPPPYKSGDVVSGVVTRIEPYGAFVALDPPATDNDQHHTRRQFKGLIHVSALRPSEEGRVEHPSEVVTMDERRTVLVLEIIPPEENMGMRGGQYKIRLSLSAIDPTTQKVRAGFEMPPPRGNVSREQDFGTGDAGYYGGGGGGRPGGFGGRNKVEVLQQRSEDRRRLRLEQDGMEDRGRINDEGGNDGAWRMSVAEMKLHHRG